MLFKNAPIIIPTLNRYAHLKRCVESLANNPLAKDSELVISLDYPPHEKYREGWEKIKEYLPTIVGFGKVTVLSADENIGAAKNCDKLRSYVKGLGYDAFILAEDDNVFAPNFLDYMNWGLRTFKEDKTILAICGFKRVDVSFLKNNVYKYPQFVAWGYGMWFDRREKLEKWTDFTILKKYVDKCSLSVIFSRRIFTITSIMRMVKDEYILGDTLPSLLPKEERFCIYPKISKVRNEGFDGSGLHCGGDNEKITQKYNSVQIDESKSFVPQISEPLYISRLSEVYKSAYRIHDRFKGQLIASTQFLIYRFTGRFWRF